MADPSFPAPVAFAHSVAGAPTTDWEPLDVHLRAVADRAAMYCGVFGSAAWGRLAGLWHDLGKYRPEFQRKLMGEHLEVEHAGLGAALAVSKHPGAGLPLAFVIAGHHAGLANRDAQVGPGRLPLTDRLRNNTPLLTNIGRDLIVPTALLAAPLPPFPPFIETRRGAGSDSDHVKRRVEFWTRMLFSGLVDADRRETAAFYAGFDPAIQLHDAQQYDALPVLRDRLDAAIDAMARAAATGTARTAVNVARAEVLSACRRAAALPPGRFSLTVPTGGGKTLSAMSFALNHAVAHAVAQGLRRVIVVIPFTSIIEQNAQVYRDVLNDPGCPEVNNVVEHHSNLDRQALMDENPEQEIRRELAAENWDAPVIVTTSVQFFESLFSDNPSRCRKLHNIARSVIILDEVQTLPAEFLLPILEALAELTDPNAYGCSVVLSTATPPALRHREGRNFGLKDVREIIADPADLSRRLRRVRTDWPKSNDGVLTYERLAQRMSRHEKVLAVVHRRRDARVVAEQLPPEGRFHLSALMCPAHRLDALRRMRAALRQSGACRLVATQLIEAGVDIDFPVVYRALAGMDSLAQAAGRCNREGILADEGGKPTAGEFVVFRAETNPPTRALSAAMESTLTMLAAYGPELDLFDPDRCVEFFDNLYFKASKDARGIQASRAALNFATVGADFRLIDDYTLPVLVPYGDAEQRLAAYRRSPTRQTRRALQPFIVQIAPYHREALMRVGAIAPVDQTVDELTTPFRHLYDTELFGLGLGEAPADPAVLIV
jgi:CRISPR-associated endonuclease/helicase Cas3